MEEEELQSISSQNNTSADLRSQNTFTPHTGESQTVLGAIRPNPWTTQAMTNAYNAVAQQSTGISPIGSGSELPATHYYVKFTPGSLDDLKTLFEHDIMYYDFPLEYEVISMGDYYDPGNEQDLALRPRYAIIPVGDTIPNVSHQVLEDLLLAPTYSYLTWKSYQLVGLDYEDEDALFEALNISPGDTINTSATYWCSPGHTEWPQCLEVEPPPGDGDPPSGPCDCGSSSSRDPSGCISYEDTELGTQGLPNIKVVTKDDWFTEDHTFSDEWGCWEINDNYRGKAWIFVRFKNEKGIVRSLDFQNTSVINPIFSYMGSIRDYGGVRRGPSFNNINIHYGYSDQDGTNAKRYWYGAHAIKSLEEFHEYCIQDGITTPSADLDILITGIEGDAAAPMLDDLFETAYGFGFINFLLSTTNIGISGSAAIISAVTSWGGVGSAVVVVASNIISAYIAIWLPDIVYNYGGENISNATISDNYTSDLVSNTFYHEYAHASNYREILTNESPKGKYWCDNIDFVLSNFVQGNDSYGNGGHPGSDRCAIIETWGFTIGPLYAHRKYGSNFNVNFGLDWINRLERANLIHTFIPRGLSLDLNDGVNLMDPSGFPDEVDNISWSQIFQSHSQACTDNNCFRAEIINNRGSNTQNSIENLLNNYGVN